MRSLATTLFPVYFLRFASIYSSRAAPRLPQVEGVYSGDRRVVQEWLNNPLNGSLGINNSFPGVKARTTGPRRRYRGSGIRLIPSQIKPKARAVVRMVDDINGETSLVHVDLWTELAKGWGVVINGVLKTGIRCWTVYIYIGGDSLFIVREIAAMINVDFFFVRKRWFYVELLNVKDVIQWIFLCSQCFLFD